MTSNPNPNLAAALAYSATGWHVFPLRPGDKRPAAPDHGETTCPATHPETARSRDPRCLRAGRHVTWEQRATCDTARITAAWTRSPGLGVGIACGPSGLLVIDLDQPSGGKAVPAGHRLAGPGVIDGADVLTALAETHHQAVELDTRTVATPSGGTHLYYHRADARLGNTSGQLGPLIDTRGTGGYVAAPPTRTAVGAYTVVHEAAPVPLPGWLAALLFQHQAPAMQAAPARLPARFTDRAGYAAAALDDQARRVAETPAGGRNRQLFLSACILGQLAAAGQLATADIRAALETAATHAGLAGTEITRTITSGLAAGAHRPRTTQPPNPTEDPRCAARSDVRSA